MPHPCSQDRAILKTTLVARPIGAKQAGRATSVKAAAIPAQVISEPRLHRTRQRIGSLQANGDTLEGYLLAWQTMLDKWLG
jgi:hypothetical protein